MSKSDSSIEFSSNYNDEPTSHCGKFCKIFKSEAISPKLLRFRELSYGVWPEQYGHDPKRCFTQWQSQFIWRIICAVFQSFTLGLALYSSVMFYQPEYFLIYLTNLTLLILWSTSLALLYCTWAVRPSSLATVPKIPPLWVKMTWILHSLAFTMTTFVFVAYWTLLFPGKKRKDFASSYFTHGVVSFVCWADTYVGGQPYKLFSAGVFTGTFAIAYVSWTVIHHFAKIGTGNYVEVVKNVSGTEITVEEQVMYIYNFIDWSNPGSAAIFTVALLFILIPLVIILLRYTIYLRGDVDVFKRQQIAIL